jgi:uncharacterized protein YaaQ
VKLLLAVLEATAADRVAEALVAGGFGVTRIDTVGGFLRRGNGCGGGVSCTAQAARL